MLGPLTSFACLPGLEKEILKSANRRSSSGGNGRTDQSGGMQSRVNSLHQILPANLLHRPRQGGWLRQRKCRGRARKHICLSKPHQHPLRPPTSTHNLPAQPLPGLLTPQGGQNSSFARSQACSENVSSIIPIICSVGVLPPCRSSLNPLSKSQVPPVCVRRWEGA